MKSFCFIDFFTTPNTKIKVMLFAITYKTNNALGFDIDFRLYCGFVEFISFFLFLITALEVSDQMT